MPSTPISARQRLTNFSRRFSRRVEGSYFPDPVETEPAAVSNEASHSHSSSWEPPKGHTITDNNGTAAPHTTTTSNNLAPPSTETPNTTPSTDSASPLSPQYQLRPPAPHRPTHASSPNFRLPDLPWLCGTWHVTHSTLPMWKNKRNVRIAYTRLSGNKLDDLVTYQNLDSNEIKSVRGVDTSKRDGSYVWRGKGMLKVASSRWEVLGWGGGGRHVESSIKATTGLGDRAGQGIVDVRGMDGTTDAVVEAGDDDANGKEENDSEQWVVTYFAKTPFTPAGIDIYSRKSRGLSERTMKKLRTALARLDGRKTQDAKPKNDLGKMVDQIFNVTSDGARADLVE